jgi:trimethylamine-N-oxide reductase (cytochrome c)
MDPLGKQTHIQNCFKDICENSNAVLFWGCDVLTTAATQAGMFPSRMEYFWSELGIKQIYICPDVNYAAAVHADKWFPVLPNTDAALQLAIAYTWIVEGTYDKDYLDTHAVGVDNFFNYVLGGEDGVAKTPKWAEEKCGIPSRQIKALARYWAKSNVCTAHCNGGSFIRSCYSHEPARLEVILLAMQALGHPGRNQMSMMEWGIHSKDTAKPIALSEYNINFGSIWPGEYYGQVTKNFIPKTMIPEALMLQEGEKLDWYGHVNSGFPRADQFSHFEFPNPDGGKNIHMVWSDAPCWSTCWNNGFKLQDCWRNPAIETFVVEHPWLENDACYADLILPVTTLMEDDDIVTSGQSGDYDVALAAQKAVDTVGEAMGDFDIVLLIADKLGKREAVLRELCKFDDDVDVNAEIGEDYVGYLRRFAWDHCWSDLNMSEPMTFEEFEEKGYFVVPAKEGWEDARPGLIDFYEDPENNPLLTPTGKLEFYSTGIAKFFPDDEIRSPVPKWIEEDDCHHERLTCDRGQDYPFLLVSNHPHFRFHAQYDDCIWFREIPMCKVDGPDGYKYEPVWVNTIDARNLGLKNGDIVKLFNERGGVLGGVIVTERVPRHTLLQDHGSRVDAIIPGEGGLDRGGANNLICPYNTSSKNAVGEVTSGFLVGIEKVDVFELAKQYPDAFNKDYAPEDGIHVSNYIVEKEA